MAYLLRDMAYIGAEPEAIDNGKSAPHITHLKLTYIRVDQGRISLLEYFMKRSTHNSGLDDQEDCITAIEAAYALPSP